MSTTPGVRELKPRYVLAKAYNESGLDLELNKYAAQGYKALFTVETNDGKMCVVMELEAQ